MTKKPLSAMGVTMLICLFVEFILLLFIQINSLFYSKDINYIVITTLGLAVMLDYNKYRIKIMLLFLV